MKFTIEIDLTPNEEALLKDKITNYCVDWFNKVPVLQQHVVSRSFSEGEVKWLVYYGRPDAKSDLRIDDGVKRLDLAIEIMFDLLEKHSVIDRTEAEKVFWRRIRALANCG